MSRDAAGFLRLCRSDNLIFYRKLYLIKNLIEQEDKKLLLGKPAFDILGIAPGPPDRTSIVSKDRAIARSVPGTG